MNTLEDKIQQDLKSAMMMRQTNTVDALRSVKAQIQMTKTGELEKGGKRELDDNDIMTIISTLVKERKDSMEQFSKAGRHDLADKEQQEMFVLMNYLPKMLTEEELNTIVSEHIRKNGFNSIKNMGDVMTFLRNEYPNQFDGKLASTVVKNNLTKQ